MATNDKSDSKKSTDGVAKPGKSTPDTSARPVVISHRPMVQDPTLKQTDETGQKPVSTRSTKVIKPVDEPAVETTPAETPPEKAAADPKPDVPTTDPVSDEGAIVDAVVDQATADKKKQNELSDAEKAKQALVAKLTAEKKYFVPIGQVAKRRNRRAIVLLLVFILLVAGGYLAADAGIIKTSIPLPVHIVNH